MAKPPSKAVQLRVFTKDGEEYAERQVFDSRSHAISYLTNALSTAGLLLTNPHEGREDGEDPYAVLFPWHRVDEVDIIPYYEGRATMEEGE